MWALKKVRVFVLCSSTHVDLDLDLLYWPDVHCACVMHYSSGNNNTEYFIQGVSQYVHVSQLKIQMCYYWYNRRNYFYYYYASTFQFSWTFVKFFFLRATQKDTTYCYHQVLVFLVEKIFSHLFPWRWYIGVVTCDVNRTQPWSFSVTSSLVYCVGWCWWYRDHSICIRYTIHVSCV